MLDTHSYLRVSLLSNCNLHCSYCRPGRDDSESPERQTAPEAFEAAIKFLHGTGVQKVRFTGGEPTLYRHLTRLVASTRRLSNEIHLALTTNGILLPQLAAQLGEAGVNSVNISVDTLIREKFRTITSRDKLPELLAGIEAAVKHIGLVKLNCVVMAGVNDDEVDSMIAFADQLGIAIRFIEFMPSRSTGAISRWYVSGDEIRERSGYKFQPVVSEPTSAARYFTAPDLKIKVGFINPVSHPFCAECNRLRLASDGQLYGCLFSDQATDLFAALLQSDDLALEQLAELIRKKRFLGCSGEIQAGGTLPSFLGIGG